MHPNLRWGASPDGLVRTASGEEGILEVKCFFRCRGTGVVPQPTECPDSFYDQIQGPARDPDSNPNPNPNPIPNPEPEPPSP